MEKYGVDIDKVGRFVRLEVDGGSEIDEVLSEMVIMKCESIERGGVVNDVYLIDLEKKNPW